MANGFDRTNDGALFPNDKRRNENSPNVTGNACVRCPHCGQNAEFFVSAWTKISKAGKKFMSLAFTPKEDKPQQPQNQGNYKPQRSQNQGNYNIEPPIDFDDDIPF